MKRCRTTGCALLAALGMAFLIALAASGQSSTPSDAAALRALDDQLDAYNASDPIAWVGTLHFPYVRIAGSEVTVFPTAESYIPELSLKQHGWDYARWTQRRIVQSSVGKVHVVARFTRFQASGGAVDSFEGLYVIVLRHGRWGIIARSNIAL